jgi:thioesterase domain-containing protein
LNAADALERTIRTAIPLSAAMDFRIRELGDRTITVQVPLEPNVNIHHTAFAGSIYAAGVLAAWGLGTYLLTSAGLEAELVVGRAEIRYSAPIREAFQARCAVTAEAAADFLRRLGAGDRARLQLQVAIGPGPAAILDARLVASPIETHAV